MYTLPVTQWRPMFDKYSSKKLDKKKKDKKPTYSKIHRPLAGLES